MFKTLTAFFKSWNKDFLDDDEYLENVHLETIKANSPDKMTSRKLFVDFADYDFLNGPDIEENTGNIKLASRLNVLPDRFDTEDLSDLNQK